MRHRNRSAAALEAFERQTALPMLVLAFAIIPLLVIPLVVELPPGWESTFGALGAGPPASRARPRSSLLRFGECGCFYRSLSFHAPVPGEMQLQSALVLRPLPAALPWALKAVPLTQAE